MKLSLATPTASILATAFLSFSIVSIPAVGRPIAGPGVARATMIHGDVAIRRADARATVAATNNAPLLAGDSLSTGNSGRAVVQMDGRSSIRAGHDVALRFVNLNPGHREVQLAQGTIELRLLGGSDGRPQIDTPSVKLRPDRSGSYRIGVTSRGETQITVRSGQADINADGRVSVLRPGRTLLAHGDPVITYVSAVGYDSFDRWNVSLDVVATSALAEPYVNADIAYDDFNDYGHWDYVAPYGEVWIPTDVAYGWAPYRCGQWVWEEGYGWTWVDCDSWGWTPFHYGRWFNSPYGWAWVPPPVVVEPVYQPALVGFFTYGSPDFSVSVGFSDVAWVPLAPGEVYRPWYGWHNGAFVSEANVVDSPVAAVALTREYRNARWAATGMPYRDFRSARFAQLHAVDPPHLNDTRVVRNAVPVVPTDSNLRFSGRSVSPELAGRAGSAERTFAGRGAAARRISFQQERGRLSAGIDPAIMYRGQRGPAMSAASNRNNGARGASFRQQNATLQHANVQRAPLQHANVQRAPAQHNAGYRAPAPAYHAYHAPANQAPAYRAPAPAHRSYRAPANQAPAYRAPAPAHHSYRAPANQGPTYHAPAPVYHTYRAPANQAPAYHAPAYHAPAYRQPQQGVPYRGSAQGPARQGAVGPRQGPAPGGPRQASNQHGSGGGGGPQGDRHQQQGH